MLHDNSKKLFSKGMVSPCCVGGGLNVVGWWNREYESETEAIQRKASAKGNEFAILVGVHVHVCVLIPHFGISGAKVIPRKRSGISKDDRWR